MRNIQLGLTIVVALFTLNACLVVQNASFSISNTSTSAIYVTFLEHAKDLQSDPSKIYKVEKNSKKKETFTWYYSGVFESNAYIYTSEDLELQNKNYTKVPIRLNNKNDIQYVYSNKRTFD